MTSASAIGQGLLVSEEGGKYPRRRGGASQPVSPSFYANGSIERDPYRSHLRFQRDKKHAERRPVKSSRDYSGADVGKKVKLAQDTGKRSAFVHTQC